MFERIISFFRLQTYNYYDVDFEDEEFKEQWCDSSSTTCTSCNSFDSDDWTRCADRTMTPRVVFSLRRLAALVSQKWGGRGWA